MQAGDFALAHRDATVKLPQVFAKGDLQDQLFHFAEFVFGGKRERPTVHLAQGLDIGGDPAEAVGSELFGLKRLAGNAAVNLDLCAQGFAGGDQQIVDRGHGGGGQFQ